MEKLAFVYTNELFTDVTICVHLGGKEHLFKVHKSFLAYFSSVLEKQFYGDDLEGPSYIELTDIDPQGLEYVLKQMYCVPPSRSQEIDSSVLIPAYHAVVVLGMQQLENYLKKLVIDQTITYSLITKEDFWKNLELSRSLKLEDIRNELLKFAECNREDLLRAKSFIKASSGAVKQVLDMNCLKAPEVDVLESIFRWKEGNMNVPFVDEITKDLLRCVRFRSLSLLDLRPFVARLSDLIGIDEMLAIIKHLQNSTSSPLPDWCSAKIRSPVNDDSEDSCTVSQGEKISDTAKLPEILLPRDFPGLLNMYIEQKYADVSFLFGDERKPIKAHRWVLALGSPVFENMFFRPLVKSQKVIIDLEGCSLYIEGFKKMLKYFYDDSNPNSLFENLDDAVKTFDVALKYGSMNLKNVCVKYYALASATTAGTTMTEESFKFPRKMKYAILAKSSDPSEVKRQFMAKTVK